MEESNLSEEDYDNSEEENCDLADDPEHCAFDHLLAEFAERLQTFIGDENLEVNALAGRLLSVINNHASEDIMSGSAGSMQADREILSRPSTLDDARSASRQSTLDDARSASRQSTLDDARSASRQSTLDDARSASLPRTNISQFSRQSTLNAARSASPRAGTPLTFRTAASPLLQEKEASEFTLICRRVPNRTNAMY